MAKYWDYAKMSQEAAVAEEFLKNELDEDVKELENEINEEGEE